MSETSQARSRAEQAQETGTEHVPPQTRGRVEEDYRQTGAYRRESGWDWGGIAFASTLLMVAGAFNIIVGLTAIFNSGFYTVTESGLVINVDYNAWGWVHFGLGVVALAAGMGLLAGQQWARVAGIAMASISAIVSLAFIPAYPLWSLVVIALDIVVIYAIAVHGGRERTTA
ncbi:tryptophan-rich sensory protein [Saccharomonospora piscinae]|uniref:Tryptophan-rich sensory protein n=1 Tax=Saccharomonospora piscinae TaxID=687388 RepID=A0A1V9A1A5_SACPI|nr:tryptophan-rich sensory protein [Saccharomonospora piscinae]OQO90861.1 tryptophan-rich sensory protein [Saccharomonospora piscinae]TLW93533.1 tryptophan-rich sensory protein [Saccharomonospora piscinae]